MHLETIMQSEEENDDELKSQVCEFNDADTSGTQEDEYEREKQFKEAIEK